MKAILAITFVVFSASLVSAQSWDNRNSGWGSQRNSQPFGQTYGSGSNPSGHFVQPHIRNDGSLNSGGFRSNPNNTQFDNFGSRGNVNPYSGSVGTRSPRY